MKYRAIIKKSGEWWIGWLTDLPGVNAQEKTKESLLESLKIGAVDFLTAEVPFIQDGEMTTIDIDENIFFKKDIILEHHSVGSK